MNSLTHNASTSRSAPCRPWPHVFVGRDAGTAKTKSRDLREVFQGAIQQEIRAAFAFGSGSVRVGARSLLIPPQRRACATIGSHAARASANSTGLTSSPVESCTVCGRPRSEGKHYQRAPVGTVCNIAGCKARLFEWCLLGGKVIGRHCVSCGFRGRTAS